MSFNTNLNKLSYEKNQREFANLNVIWMPSHMSTIQNLPPLNAVSWTLMPTGKKYFGIFEVGEEPIPVYPTQPHLSQPKFLHQSTQMWHREERMPWHIGSEGYLEEQHPSAVQHFPLSVTPNGMKILAAPIHSEPRSWNQEYQNPIPPNLMAPSKIEDITNQNVERGALYPSRASRGSVISSSFDSSSANQIQAPSTGKVKKFGSSWQFWTCGMTKSQSYLVKRILTPNNMRFLELLKNYEYEIAEEKSPLTGKPLPKYIWKHKGSCNKKFERTWKLLDHCRTHSGVRPYSWTIWGRKFTQKGNRNKHMLKHE